MNCFRQSGTLLLALLITLAWHPARSTAAPGLLLVAHGSPSPEWNKPLLAFGEKVAAKLSENGQYKAVRTAMLEAAQPDVATAVAELQAAGCSRIVAIPLFVAPSGHTHFDVPAVLGIYRSPAILTALAQEGANIARPSVPIVLTLTVSQGGVLEKFASEEVRRLSKAPADEAVVILAHGDPDHQLLVDRHMRRVVTCCCGQSGIDYGDWAYIAVGQEYHSAGVSAIQTALQHKKRVLVVGLYISTSAAKIYARAVAMPCHHESKSDPFQGQDVVFSDATIVAHPALMQWVLDTAGSALEPPKP